MKTVVKSKMPKKAKPGQLLSGHIEYDQEGDGAHTTYMHAPEAGKKNDPWMPGPSPSRKSFSTRMEAHHHMAQMAGVPAEMEEARAHGKGDSSDGPLAGPGESEGDEDEDEAENRGADDDPGARPVLTKAKPPARNI